MLDSCERGCRRFVLRGSQLVVVATTSSRQEGLQVKLCRIRCFVPAHVQNWAFVSTVKKRREFCINNSISSNYCGLNRTMLNTCLDRNDSLKKCLSWALRFTYFCAHLRIIGNNKLHSLSKGSILSIRLTWSSALARFTNCKYNNFLLSGIFRTSVCER